MTTLIMRSFIVHMGGNPPPDLACVVDGRVVTWAEVMRNRRERQARLLAWKRRDYTGRWVPLRLSVRFYDMMIMGGWHAYLHGAAGYEEWVRGDRYRRDLMRLLPLPALIPTDDFDVWLEQFARCYRVGRADRKPRGSLIIWARCTGHGPHLQPEEFALRPPEVRREADQPPTWGKAAKRLERRRGRALQRVRGAAAADAP